MQHQGLLFCWLSCSARVICFSKTSRNAKVGLSEHTHFLCRKERMAKLRWGERREGEVICPAPSTWVASLLIVTTRAAAYPSWHLSSGSWLAGLLFLKKSLRWVWEAERGKEPTFVEVYSSKHSVRNFISIIEPLCDPPHVNVWFLHPNFGSFTCSSGHSPTLLWPSQKGVICKHFESWSPPLQQYKQLSSSSL